MSPNFILQTYLFLFKINLEIRGGIPKVSFTVGSSQKNAPWVEIDIDHRFKFKLVFASSS